MEEDLRAAFLQHAGHEVQLAHGHPAGKQQQVAFLQGPAHRLPQRGGLVAHDPVVARPAPRRAHLGAGLQAVGVVDLPGAQRLPRVAQLRAGGQHAHLRAHGHPHLRAAQGGQHPHVLRREHPRPQDPVALAQILPAGDHVGVGLLGQQRHHPVLLPGVLHPDHLVRPGGHHGPGHDLGALPAGQGPGRGVPRGQGGRQAPARTRVGGVTRRSRPWPPWGTAGNPPGPALPRPGRGPGPAPGPHRLGAGLVSRSSSIMARALSGCSSGTVPPAAR